jgi:glycosyltransferase involved in cell wall biosynthesis
MRVAVVAGHFMPELGYQEVYLARACSRLGHDVRVVTSDRVSPSGRQVLGDRYEPGRSKDPNYGFSIVRLRSALQFGAVVLASGLKREVEEFRPELTLVIGVGKLFPLPLLSRRRQYRLAAVFGDNSDYWDFSSPSLGLRSVRSKVTQRLVKDILYRRAVRNADRVCLTTPETKTIVAASLTTGLRRVLEEKHVFLPLGFDADEFFFSDAERERNREQLDVSADECVFVTCTRVNAKKNLERVIDGVSSLRSAGHKVRYVIVGFLGDSYEAELKEHIERQPDPEIFHCFPFLAHERMRGLYCAADVGVWLKAAISIQQSMGTGLPVLLEAKPSVGHLVQDGITGWHFRPGELVSAMEASVDARHFRPREEIASDNLERLSYDRVAEELIASVSAA